MTMLKLSDYDYPLPDELIAQYPPTVRGDSRLLVGKREGGKLLYEDRHFTNLLEYLKPNDLLIFNNTRVIPARLFGEKRTGGRVEVMIERLLNERQALAQLRASRPPKEGQSIYINGMAAFTMLGRQGDFFLLESADPTLKLTTLLDQFGEMPLPPYITRENELDDKERYQTVFSQEKGAVAAPTAGLHFTDTMLSTLSESGIESAKVTLHVGAGTFQPIRVDDLTEHRMHQEWIDVPRETVDKILATQAKGGRIIAVGTTVVRALESAALSGSLKPFSGDTDIFIKPGFSFRVVDGLLTNFHLPQSTLLVLVSTLMGYEEIRTLYHHAIKARYRFFSYGDAMLLLP